MILLEIFIHTIKLAFLVLTVFFCNKPPCTLLNQRWCPYKFPHINALTYIFFLQMVNTKPTRDTQLQLILLGRYGTANIHIT